MDWRKKSGLPMRNFVMMTHIKDSSGLSYSTVPVYCKVMMRADLWASCEMWGKENHFRLKQVVLKLGGGGGGVRVLSGCHLATQEQEAVPGTQQPAGSLVSGTG